jgi:hypothetical protein
MPLRFGFAATLLVIAGIAVSARAQARQKKEGPVYLDSKDAGPNYVVQGEYLGQTPDRKLGAQVIADGNGTFTVIILEGGLPGEGFDGKTRASFRGKDEGDHVLFKGADPNDYSGSIKEGVLTAQSKGGAYSLKKVKRESPDAGEKPPAGATVLFDGTNVDAWQNGKMDMRHLLEAGTKTKQKYEDFKLHVEFLLPFKPEARDQERGNSGIYIQDRYEVQILDTFGHPPEFNGCGSLYRQHAPSVNMCYPPLRWQTYDIDFHAAKFDSSGKKIHNAVVTVKQNGVIVQDHYEITAKTGAGAKEGPEPGSIQLQGHNNPVFFRNVWVVGGAGRGDGRGE